MRFLQQERERERKRKLSEGTSNRLPIQSYDNYFAQPLRTRITRGLVFLFSFFFLSFPHLNQYPRSSRVSAKTITCIISRTNKEEPVSRVPGTTRKGTRKGTGVGRDARQRKRFTVTTGEGTKELLFLSRLGHRLTEL